MTPTADTPVPRQLSEEERALWEKATALEAAAVRYDDLATTASKAEHHAATLALVTAQEALDKAASPAVILSLLTALSSEREAGKSDARRMKEHVRGCGECSAGDFCDEGESYGGEVTSNYLYRITAANGCRADAVERSIAERRATRSTGGE